MKLKGINDSNGILYGYEIYCPGCKGNHMYKVAGDGWKFNGNMDKPTFTPSFLSHETEANLRCHFFVTDGVIIFCNDSQHRLANKRVDLPDYKDGVIYTKKEAMDRINNE